MITQHDLLQYLNTLLTPEIYHDYAPNGLQVAGKTNIERIVTGVTASLALIEAAIEHKADAIIVHHGYFWKGEDPRIIGVKKNRLQQLLAHDINLFAYHLPLDGHPHVGNNVQLAKLLDFIIEGEMPNDYGKNIGLYGKLSQAMSADEFYQHLSSTLARAPQHIAAEKKTIERIAWCTGAADKMIADAAALGVDAFISGEISEPTVHIAREMNIHYFGCGHHATERYGIKSLLNEINEKLDVICQFVDIDNPV